MNTTATESKTKTKKVDNSFTSTLGTSITIPARKAGQKLADTARKVIGGKYFIGGYGDCLFIGNTKDKDSYDGVYYHLSNPISDLEDDSKPLIFTRNAAASY